MKTIQHLLQTIGLITFIGILSQIPADNYHITLIACGLGIVALLVFLAFYLVLGRRKGLFAFLMAVMLTTAPTIGHAGWIFSDVDSEETVQEYQNFIEQKGPGVCDANGKFFPENKDGKPDVKVHETALEIVDKYDKLGLSEVEDIHEFYEECASEYVQKVADWQKMQEEKLLDKVPVLLQAEKGQCWPCGVADLMIEAVEQTVFVTEDFLKQISLIILGFMTLFWLAFKVLNLIATMATGGHSEFFTDILIRLSVVAIVAILLQNSMVHVYEITMSPIIGIGTNIARQITELQPVQNTPIESAVSAGSPDLLGCTCCDNVSSNCHDAKSMEHTYEHSTKRFLEQEDRAALLCATCRVYKQTAPFVASGQALVRYSFKNKNWMSKLASFATAGKTDNIPYPPGMWILGGTMIIVFTIVAFVVAFKLIDIFIRLGFVFVLMPLLVMAYAFPASRQYTKKGWDFFVYSVLSLIALSVGTSLLLLAFTSLLSNNAFSTLGAAMVGQGMSLS